MCQQRQLWPIRAWTPDLCWCPAPSGTGMLAESVFGCWVKAPDVVSVRLVQRGIVLLPWGGECSPEQCLDGCYVSNEIHVKARIQSFPAEHCFVIRWSVLLTSPVNSLIDVAHRCMFFSTKPVTRPKLKFNFEKNKPLGYEFFSKSGVNGDD